MSGPSLFHHSATTPPEISARFADIHPPLEPQAAFLEANRCLYCFDAPCASACPTHIDVPRFIKKIASGNLPGSARTILDANILGASCARACPVEVLCEGACVMHHQAAAPIQIGRLQRFAMDALHASGAGLPFKAGADAGSSVALVGGGPASLSCAAELRRRGIGAEIYDARPLPGGLNTYGVAEYKLPLAESLREIDMLAQLGVVFHYDVLVDATMLAELGRGYDAVFVGTGLGAVRRLGLQGDALDGIIDALAFIAAYKSGYILTVPSRVAVVGGGNTAIDAAIAAVRLGALDVTVLYRRGAEQMSAFSFEYEHALREGVKFRWNVQPVRIHGRERLQSVELVELASNKDGFLMPVERSEFMLDLDLLIFAIGQTAHTGLFNANYLNRVATEDGRILVNRATGQTSLPNVFAGGDCINGGREVVDAVADGKRAAIGIAAWLEGTRVHD
ncbi:MAG TPA: NAD(P)-dependent oxidoreductase [Acidisarcina sp.]